MAYHRHTCQSLSQRNQYHFWRKTADDNSEFSRRIIYSKQIRIFKHSSYWKRWTWMTTDECWYRITPENKLTRTGYTSWNHQKGLTFKMWLSSCTCISWSDTFRKRYMIRNLWLLSIFSSLFASPTFMSHTRQYVYHYYPGVVLRSAF